MMPWKKKKPYVYQIKSCYDNWDNKILSNMEKFCDSYKNFLDNAKTERLGVKTAISLLKKGWFVDLNKVKDLKWKRVFFQHREKNVFAIIPGKKPLKEWLRLICAHLDSPRVDIKLNPMYDWDWFCLMKTHYYWGIKKYQWLTIPLSLIWVIYDKNWKKIEINIWEDPKDPVFFLSDILPHLGREQMEKKVKDLVEAEEMNLIVGSKYSPQKEEVLKENILKLLYDKYWITEKSFFSAELELVPWWKTRDVGFDKSLIWGYGHDDRGCSFASLMSLIDYKKVPEYTSIVYLVDKEEIWSDGATWAKSRILSYVIWKLFTMQTENFNIHDFDEMYYNTYAISADSSSLVDPNFKWMFDPMNNWIVNNWLTIEKYTWAWWKYMANHADTEYMYKLMEHFDKNNIVYQLGWLGKVDKWWGWTISKYLAYYGMNIIDAWPALLNVHSPFEIVSKADLYSAYLGFKSFWDLK